MIRVKGQHTRPRREREVDTDMLEYSPRRLDELLGVVDCRVHR